MSTNPWLPFAAGENAARQRLFCFPNAGGDAAVYRPWSNELGRDVQVCAVQMPGHGKRLGETPFRRMTELVAAVLDGIRAELDRPFAFFGHGSGALLAFELTRSLRRAGSTQPVRLFLSGHRAPHLPSRLPEIHQLNEEEFRDALQVREDVPAEVLEHPELTALLSPVLRGDYELWETYHYRAEEPLEIPLEIMGGLSDPTVESSELEAWSTHSLSPSRVERFPGGRLYLHQNLRQVTATISRELHAALTRPTK
jgi:medium-chain acyl-[acyl-carrier-protein] hydrolase